MSDSKLNQGSEINELVNNRNNSLLIPSGNMWYSPLKVYPSYIYNLLKLAFFLVKQLFSDKTSFQTKSAHILVSVGQGYDLKHYSKLFLDSNVEVIYLEGLRVLGDPSRFARYYYENGANEIIYQDIVASLYDRNSLTEIINKTAKEIFIPLVSLGK